MPVPNALVSVSLIMATVVTAAGLNMAVMALNRSDAASPGDAAAEAESAAPTEVELTAASIAGPDGAAPVPVLAVSLGSRASADESVVTDRLADGLTATTEHEPPSSSAVPSSASAPTPAPTGAAPPSTGSPTTDTVAPPSTAPPTSPTVAPPTTARVPSPTVPVSTEYLTYEFEGIASIIIALHDGRALEFWSVTPEDGWVFLVEERGPREVKIKFRPAAGGEEAEFEAKFEGDRLKIKREY